MRVEKPVYRADSRAKRVIVLTVIALLLLPACTRQEARGGPNVLIILTDDQRASGTLSVMPLTWRWLVQGGVKFNRAYATTPQCCPSRASIFTGQYSHNHGVLNNTEGWAERLDEDGTLQRYLHDAGYSTALFGKFLNEWDVRRNPRHFDRWAVFPSQGDLNYYQGGEWNVDGEVRKVPDYYTTFITAEAEQFLREAEEDDDRPWLLFLSPTAPHAPFVPDAKYKHARVPPAETNPAIAVASGLKHKRSSIPPLPGFGSSSGKSPAKKTPQVVPTFTGFRGQVAPANKGKPPHMSRAPMPRKFVQFHRENQLRTLMSVDEMVRKVSQALQKAAEIKNTLVFFLSDNGYLWGEYGTLGKGFPYTEAARIPMLMSWPARLPKGQTSKAIVANVDILPTVLDAANIEPDLRQPLDGVSLLDVLSRREKRSRLLLEHWGVEARGIPPWASIVTNSYQYVEHYDSEGKVSFREHYDLRADPWELKNLLTEPTRGGRPDVTELTAQLREDKGCRGVNCP